MTPTYKHEAIEAQNDSTPMILMNLVRISYVIIEATTDVIKTINHKQSDNGKI